MKHAGIWSWTVLLIFTACSDATCPVPDPPSATDLTTHRVPSEYATVQAAMDAAVDGDTVLVSPGTYEGPGNVELDPHGVSMVIRSAAGPESTIIRLHSGSSVVTAGFKVTRGERSPMAIEGFTFRDGAATLGAPTAIVCVGGQIQVENCHVVDHAGPAIHVTGSTAALKYCRVENTRSQEAPVLISESVAVFDRCAFRGNTTQDRGGAVRVEQSYAILRDCEFIGNTCEGGTGGALHLEASEVGVGHCLLARNRSAYGGGAIFADGTGLRAGYCTISENSSPENGGGIALSGTATSVLIEDTIVTANCPEDLVGGKGTRLTVYTSAVDTTRIRGEGHFRYSTTIITADPALCRLEGCFGERESDYRPRPGSPCLTPNRIGALRGRCEN